MLKKVFLNFLIICGVSAASVAQPDKNSWVDSVFNSLNIDEKIGQLLMHFLRLDVSDDDEVRRELQENGATIAVTATITHTLLEWLLTAVIGLASAMSRSAALANGEYGRVVEPWVGDVALLVLAAILVERAFRRDATSFIYAAALALLIALTDFNLTYLSDSTEAALLIEGLILLAVGVATDRLRRRVGRDGGPPVEEPGPRDGEQIAIQGETL
jgi:hypothetical protein